MGNYAVRHRYHYEAGDDVDRKHRNPPFLYVEKEKAGDEDPGETIDDIRRTLFKMEYVWKHGQTPAKDYWPEDLGQSYPAETTSNRKKPK